MALMDLRKQVALRDINISSVCLVLNRFPLLLKCWHCGLDVEFLNNLFAKCVCTLIVMSSLNASFRLLPSSDSQVVQVVSESVCLCIYLSIYLSQLSFQLEP